MDYIYSLISSVLVLIIFYSMFEWRNNAFNMLMIFLTLIPVVGSIFTLMVTFVIVVAVAFDCQSDYTNDFAESIRLRDHSFNRWLFNQADDEWFNDNNSKMINE